MYNIPIHVCTCTVCVLLQVVHVTCTVQGTVGDKKNLRATICFEKCVVSK